MVKREKLPSELDDVYQNFLDYQMNGKNKGSKDLGVNAFRNWQDYLNHKPTREEITDKDISEFVTRLKKVRKIQSGTISDYLGQLEPFFKLRKLESAASEANIQKNLLNDEKEKYQPIKMEDLFKMYRKAKPKGRVIIRLLLFEEVGIRLMARLYTGKDSDEYHFWYNNEKGEKVSVTVKNEDTIRLAKEYLGIVKKPFFKAPNGVSNFIKEASRAVQQDYRITAKSLRTFAKYVNREELNRWLSKEDAYHEEPICLMCGKKLED